MNKKSLLTSGRGLTKRYCRPRPIGDFINEMLQSNEPLAVALRNWMAEHEKNKTAEGQTVSRRLPQALHPNTELGIDLKLLTHKQGRLKLGSSLPGILTHDSEEHFTFLETQPSTAGKRNPHVFEGKYITITRRDDGSLRPNFKPMQVDKNFRSIGYAISVANELIQALTCLLGK